MLSSNNQTPEKARAYAFLLLKFRLRSQNELKARLKQKGFSEELAVDTVNFLKDRDFIDDRVFAKNWITSRLKRSVGLKKIRLELAQKGLASEIIAEGLAGVKEGYNEKQVALRLAKERFLKLKGVELVKAKGRIYGYLMRRGFPSDVVNDIVKAL